MADPSKITALVADQELVCADDRVRITATIEPQNGNVTWSGDLGSAGTPQPPDGLSSFDTFFSPGENVITATTDTNSMSITVRAGRLAIEVDGGSRQLISGGAEMPELNATVIVEGGVPTGTITWTAEVLSGGIDLEGCPNAPSPLPPGLSQTFSGTGPDISVDLGGRVLGGGLFIEATATIGASTCTHREGARIAGTNPDQNSLQAALPHDTLRRIACLESGQRQFDAAADGGEGSCPLFSSDRQGKAGVMQIPDPSLDELWSWRLNVEKGIEIFVEKVAGAQDYPERVRSSAGFQDLVDQFNARRQQDGLSSLDITLPEFTSGNFDDDLQQLERDAIRGYDGWFGTDRFGFELHEFRVAVDTVSGVELLQVINIDEQAGTGEAVWQTVPVTDRPQDVGDPDYVSNVMALSPTCVAQAPTAPILFGPDTFFRGERITFRVLNAAQGATLSDWLYVGGGQTISRRGNNNFLEWQGVMVQSGTVSVEVATAAGSEQLALDVTVTPRPWSENAPQVPLGKRRNGFLNREPRRDGDLGRTLRIYEIDPDTRVSTIDSGPNRGFTFLLDPPLTWKPEVFTNEALYDESHPFFRAHARPGIPQGRPEIGQLQTDVEAHEGVIIPPPEAPAGYASHWQKVFNHLVNNPINSFVEGRVVHISEQSESAFIQETVDILRERAEAAKAAGTDFSEFGSDETHPPRIFAKGTYFDYPFIRPRDLVLIVGMSQTLNVSDRAGGNLTWTSGDPGVVTVDDGGTIEALGAGVTTVRVRNSDGEIDEIAVIVNN